MKENKKEKENKTLKLKQITRKCHLLSKPFHKTTNVYLNIIKYKYA